MQCIDPCPPLGGGTITNDSQQMHRSVLCMKKKKKKSACFMFSVKSLIMWLLNHPRENLKFDNGLSSAGIGRV